MNEKVTDPENKVRRYGILLLSFGLFTCFFIIAYLFYFNYNQAGQCLKDPVTFYTQQAYEQYNSNLVCTCVYDKPGYSTLVFSKEGLRIENKLGTNKEDNYPVVNLTFALP